MQRTLGLMCVVAMLVAGTLALGAWPASRTGWPQNLTGEAATRSGPDLSATWTHEVHGALALAEVTQAYDLGTGWRRSH